MDNYKFKVMFRADIVQKILDCIETIEKFLEIPILIAYDLLIFYNWNVEEVIERFSNDPGKLISEAKALKPFKNENRESAIHTDIEECTNCCTKVPIVVSLFLFKLKKLLKKKLNL